MKKQLSLSILLFIAALVLLFLLSARASADGSPALVVKGGEEEALNPGDLASYKLELKNDGDTDNFTVSLSYDNPDGNWTVYASTDELSVKEGKTKSFYVHVAAHDNDTMPVDGQDISVSVKVEAKTGGGNDSLLVNTTCWHGSLYGVELSDNATSRVARPSYGDEDNVTFRFQLKNTGKETDSFKCELNESLTDPKIQDWLVITKGAFINNLESGEAADVILEVNVYPYHEDKAATPGEKYFYLELYSEGARDNDKELVNETTALFNATVDVQEYYRLKVSAQSSDTPELGVGDHANFTLSVKNEGNAPDTITMGKDGDSNGDFSTWQDFNVTMFELGPDETASIQMTVTVVPGDEAEEGNYDFFYHAHSREGDLDSSTAFNTIKIRETFGVLVDVLTTNLNVKPGEKASFPIEITNSGNSRTEITLLKPATTYEDWEIFWASSAGSSSEISSTAQVDPDGFVDVFMRVDPSANTSKSMAGRYEIPFMVTRNFQNF